MLLPEDIVNPKIDALSVITYVSQFPEAKLKEGAPIKPAGDPSKVKAYGDGLKKDGLSINDVDVEFFVDVSEEGDGPLKVNITNPQGLALHPKIDYDRSKKIYSYKYTPGEDGEYTVNVLWFGKHVPNSPFKVNVLGSKRPRAATLGRGASSLGGAMAVTATYKVYGPGIESKTLSALVPTEFWIEGVPASSKVQVKITGPKGLLGSNGTAIESTGKGKFSVVYRPPYAGRYKIEVSAGGKEIPSSPFTVSVGEAKSKIVGWARGPGVDGTDLQAGKLTWFKVFTPTASNKDVVVTVKDPAKSQLKVASVKVIDGVFKYSYTPKQVGAYEISVLLGPKKAQQRLNFTVDVPTPEIKGPCKIWGPGIAPCGIQVGRPSYIYAKSAKPEEKKVAIAVKGPDGVVPVTNEENPDDVHTFSFEPTKVGPHTIDIQCGDESIPNYPIEVIVTDVSKVELNGPGVGGEPIPVNKMACIEVDLAEAGPGKLNCQLLAIESPNQKDAEKFAGVMAPKIVDKGNGKVEIQFTPKLPSKSSLAITFDDIPIRQSPLQLTAVDAKPAKAYGRGIRDGVPAKKPTYFMVDTKGAGQGPLKVAVAGSQKPTVKTSTKNKETYKCEYTPKVKGDYTVDVVYGKLPAEKSPFNIKVVDEGTVQKFAVYGPAVESDITVGTPVEFYCDNGDSPVDEMAVMIETPSTESAPNFEPIDDKITKCSFTPREPGPYKIGVKADGKPVDGSPFTIMSSFPEGRPQVVAQGDGLEKAYVDEWSEFSLDYSKAGTGAVDVSIDGPQKVETKVEKQKDKKALVKYLAPKRGEYEITVQFSDSEIPGSPFNVKAIPREDETAAKKVVQLEAEGLKVGNTFTYTVDASATPKETVTGKVIGPYPRERSIPKDLLSDSVTLKKFPRLAIGKKTYDTRVTPKGKTYAVDFAPKEVGVYVLYVFLGDELAPELPHKIFCCDPSKVKVTGCGLKEDEKSFDVDKPLNWKADCTKAGPGTFKAYCGGPDDCSEKFDITTEAKNEDVYLVEYVPNVPGSYQILFAYGGYDLADKPVLMVGDSSKAQVQASDVKTCLVGEEVSFKVDLSNAGAGKLQASLEGPAEAPLSFAKNNDGTCNFCFTPPEVGKYALSVSFGDKPLTDKPLEVTAINPEKINVTGPGVTGKGARVGKPAKIIVDCKEGGDAPVQLYLTTPDEKVVPLQLTKSTDEPVYEAEYIPDKVGTYELEVKIGDKPIKDSPFKALVAAPDKVKVSGPGVNGKGAEPGKPAEIIVDMTDAGPAPVEGVLSTPTGEKTPLDFKPKDESTPDVLAATYTPDQPGDYQLDITLNDEPIKGSPFKPKILEKGAARFEGPGVESAAIGEENIIDLFKPAIVPEEVTMEMMAPDHQEIPFEFFVDKVDDDHCQIKFIPETVEECEAQLCYAGAPIGEPFKLPVGDPSKCKVSGPGIEDDKLPVGKETYITVDSTEAGPGVPKVVVTGPEESKIEPVCVEEKPGVNKFAYTPEKGGAHEVAVLFGGHDVPGSPFNVPVCNPSGVKCAPLNPEEKKIHPGDEIEFTVDLTDAGEGDFNLGLLGPGNKPIVSEDAVISLEPVEETPAGEKPAGVIELKPEGPKVGSTIPYSIDTSGVQTGDVISGRVVGPFKNKKKIPKNILSDKVKLSTLPEVAKDQNVIEPEVKEENKVYDVNFTPTDVGVYVLDIFLGDNLVNDMPSLLYVSDPDQVKVTGPGLGDSEGSAYPQNTPLVWEVDCTKAGPGKVTTFCIGPDDCSKKFKVAPIPGKPDVYAVTYKPKKAGPYQVLLAFGGYEVKDRPTFTVDKPSFIDRLFGKLKGQKDSPADDDSKVPEAEKGTINQKKNDDGTYTFGFVPEKPGLYEFAPSISNNPVLEEPLTVLVTDPDKVKVSGPGVNGKGAKPGEPAEIIVDRTDAGPAPVEGVLSTPSGEKTPLDFKPKDESTPDVLAATYTPDQPGDYQLDLTLNDEPIKGSPFKPKILEKGAARFEGPGVESAAIGEENIIDLFKPAIVPEEVTMEMMAPDHQEIPFEFFVDKVDDDHCQIKFIPETVEECEAQLCYAGAPIGEPFKLPVGDPSKCKVSGPGVEDDKLPVGKETYITVDSTEAGPGVPKVVVTGPEESKIEPVCVEEKPGVNKFAYTPEKGGAHEVAVLFGGHDVPGSPFNVPVCNPSGVKCAPLNPEEKKIHPGDEIEFTVDLTGAGEGDFNLGLLGPGNKPIVSEDAVISLEPVEETPAGEKPAGVIELKPEGPKVGSTIPYSIDTSGVQTGDVISGRVVGPFKNKKKIPKNILSDKVKLSTLPEVAKDQNVIEPEVKEENKVYDVNFTPTDVGVYVLDIFLGDNLVNDMPSLLYVSDPDQVKVTGPGLGDSEGSAYPQNTPLVWEVDCTKAGPGKVTTFCIGPDDCSKKFKVAPIPGKPDVYAVTYKPKKAGPYQVLLAFGGYEVKDRPTFTVDKPSFIDRLFGKLKGQKDSPADDDSNVPEAEEGAIHQKKNDDGTYTFGFVPEKPGLYEFAPSISNNPVLEEPLTVLVTDPDMVKVSGPGVTGKGAEPGEPAEIIVDRTDAGPAPVEGVLSTPSGEKTPLDFKPKDESTPDVLAATYTPDQPGDYQLDLTLNDEPIKGSPFKPKILEKGAARFEGPGVESAAIGEENIIDLFKPAIVPEEVTMEMMAPDHQEIPFEFFVDKVDDDHCQIKFIPETVEECEAQLCYAGAPIGEPFKLPVGDPSKCKVSGPGVEDDKLPVGKETYITVDSTEAGPGVPKVVVTGPEESKIEPVCVEEKPGVNKFAYTPEKGGAHEVAVLFGGHDVPGSPFNVPVCNPSGVKCAPLNPEEKKIHPGDEIEFTVDLTDAGEGDFNLGLLGPGNKPIVSEDAVISLEPVEETPAGEKPAGVIELKPEGPKVGSTIPYSIDTSGVQTGDVISGRVVGPFKNKKKIPKNILSDKVKLSTLPEVAKDQNVIEPEVKEENKVYDVNFTPTDVGVYVLDIFLGDNLVNDMPSLLYVSDPDQVKVTGPGLGDSEGSAYPQNTPLVWEVDCTKAGPGKVTTFCIGPDDCSKKFKVAPIPGKPDVYAVTYKPKKAGPYQVLLAFGGYEVKDRPTFTVDKPSFIDRLFGKLKGQKDSPADDDSNVPEAEEGAIHQKKNDDGTYTFGFVPEKPGLYEFAPSISNNPVLEEPLTVLVTDPDMVKVSGPGVTGKGAEPGEPAEIIVDRTDAGPAPVEGVLSTPSGEKTPLDFKPKDESTPDVLAATYTPDQPGDYQLDLTLNDEPIKGSPFKPKILEKGAARFEGPGVESAAIGEENIIDLFKPAIVPEEVTMEMMAPDHQEIPFEFFVDKVDDDHCQIKFIPETVEECEAQLCYAGAPIGEPFKLPVGDPSKCKVSGPGIEDDKLPVGKETYITVDSTEAGPGVPKVVVTGPEESKIEPVCVEEKPGVNKFAYTPEKGGPHEVAVLFGGHDVPGSPFNVPVCNPSGVKCAPLNPEEKKIHPGDEIEFTVDLTDAGEGDFNLGLLGPGNKPIVSEDAIIALVPIEESPIDGNTEIVELKPEGPKVGSTIPYSIDTSGVETGDVISGRVVGPFKNKKKIPKNILSDKVKLSTLPEVAKDQNVIEPEVKEENKVYDVNFTPTDVGVYVLDIFLGDNLVNDMPSLLYVSDPDQVKVTGPGLGDSEGSAYPQNTPLVWEVDCTKAGPGKVTTFCAGPDDCSKKFKVAPIPGKPDVYAVTYKPKKAGPYQVLLAFGGYEVKDRPTFTVNKPTSFLGLLFGRLKGEDSSDDSNVPEAEEGAIHQKKNDDGTYTFGFVPEKPGLYEFAPSISNNPVLEEPLTVLVTDPDMVKVSGPGVTGKGAEPGEPAEIIVDRTDAGPAPVEGVLSTPSGEKTPLDFKPKDESTPDVLAATYTPDQPGDYQLDLTLNDEPIKGSPFKPKILEKGAARFEGPGVESAAIGEENIIDLFKPAIVPEEVTMEMMAPDYQEIPFEFFVDKVDDDHCQIKFIPETVEECEAQLCYAGAPIGEPFKLPVGDPSKCKVSGPGIEDDKLPVGKETYITVDSTEAGPGVPKVVVTGPEESKIEPVCVEEKPGVNKFAYTPEKGGPHEVAVLFGGHDVPGSPFNVPVCNPSGVKCAPLNPEEKKIHPGDEIEFTVDLTDAGEGDFNLGLLGPGNKPIVSEDAIIALVPIEESPIDGNTEIVELKPEGPKVGSTIPYSIDTSGVETGDVISGRVVGPFKNKKKIPKNILSDKVKLSTLPEVAKDQNVIEPEVKEENKVYDVNFTPTDVGVYVLDIFLGDNLVNDMPSLLYVSDPDQVKVTGPGLGDSEGSAYPQNTPLVWEVDCTKAGPGKVTTFCAGPDDCSKKFKVAPIPGKPDVYAVTYKPKKAGPYQVLLAFGGYEVKDRPTFTVNKPTSFLGLLFGRLKGEDSSDDSNVPEAEEGAIHQKKNDDGTYTFGFVPEKPGLYEFAPSISNNPVLEEPLTVLVTDPDMVKVSGPGVTGKGAEPGEPAEIIVDRTDAGPAPVEGVLSTPSGEKTPLDFKPKDESTPDVLAATYTPDQPGDYQLDLTLNDEPIKGSPFKPKILEKGAARFEGPGVESAAIGEENIIDLFKPAIVPEEVTMEMMAPDHQEIPFEFFVDKVDDDHCQIKFIPETVEECEAQLCYAGAPIGEPFKLPVGDPSKCKVSGPGIEDDKLPVGKETYITVDSTEAGPGVPKVVVTGPEESKIEPVCVEEKPGVNKFAYTPEKGGPHEVAVLFGGHDVPGSPFNVPVCNPSGVKCAPLNPEEKKIHPGDEIEFTVDLTDAGEGDFNLGLLGPGNKPIVSEDAIIALVPIEESPIDGNTEVVELKPEGPKVGSTIPYSIDTSGVETGDVISGRVVGPFKSKKKVPKNILSDKVKLSTLPEVAKDQNVIEPEVKEENKVYDVNFTPTDVGVYVLDIFLGDNLVNDMPSLLYVSDPDQVKVTGPGLGDSEGSAYPQNTPLVWEVDCTKAGPGKVTTFCAGPDDCSKKFKVASIPGKPDVYAVTYKPKKAGPYQVLLAFGGYEVKDRPTFTVNKPTSFLGLLFGKLKGEDSSDDSKVPEAEKGTINQKKNDDGTYTFGFVPDKPGLYEIAPSISNNPVLEEPLTVLVTDPDKVKVSGPGVTGKRAEPGEPAEVVVDRTDAGPAPVEGVLSTPSGEKTPLVFKPKDESTPDVLAATYTPDQPGDYQLDLTLNDEPIKGSPFKPKILEKGAARFEGPGVESAAIGEENIIDLFKPAIVPEEVTMEMMAPDHQEIPFEFFVDKVDDDHCQIKFTPETVEECEAQLCYAGAPIGEPFKLPVGDPSKCKVSGPGVEDDKLPVGKETYITVDSTEAGPGVPKVVVTGPEESKIEPVAVEEKPGVNKFTYTPEKGGPHEVAVLFGGHDVPGSPYSIPVYNLSGVKCAPVNPDNKKFHPGDEIEFTVDLKDAGEGDFNLGLLGPGNKPIVSEDAIIALVPIEESPIDGNTEVVELKPEGPKVGSTIPYSIDTSGVETGDVISGRVVGPFKNKKKIPKNILSDKVKLSTLPEVAKGQNIIEPEVKEENKVYDVNFTPTDVGVYVLDIFLGDNLVDDMPCVLSVCDANEVRILGPGLGETENDTYPLRKPLIWEAYCSTAGPGKLTAYCAGPDDCSKKFKISSIPGRENCFYIEYVPKKAGPYQMMFAFGDYEIPSKPTLVVTKPSYVALLAAHSAGLPLGKPVDEGRPEDFKPHEEGNIESAMNDDGSCTFKFKPEKPGLYEIMPTLQDEQVLEEPFSILVTDPDKAKVFGPGVTGKGVRIGKPTEVYFDRSDSGPGPVEAVLSTPSGEKETIKFEPKEENAPGILVGRYTPQIAGYHSLTVMFDDQELPISPVRVYVVNPEDFKLEGGGLKEATIGKVNIIDCLLENMPEEGTFSMVAEDKNGETEPLECEIIKVDEDSCCVEFIPDTEDACYAVLQFNDVPITDKIPLSPNAIQGAEISGLKTCQGVVINKERPFTANFGKCSPPDGELLVTMVQSDGSQIKPTLIETTPKLYKIFFTPTVLGPLKITFEFGDDEMTYTVFVIDPSAVVCTGLGGESTLVSEKQVFAIDTSQAGIGARLKIELEGDETATLSCKHMIDDHYSGVLTAMLAGVYNVRIFYGGYEIQGSPFECKFHRLEADATLCSITDFESTPGKFVVDCRHGGGCGVLEVAVYGAYVPARYIAVEHNGDYTFSVQYDITDPVETLISVKWHGEHLAGSPFKVVFKK